MGRIQFTNIVIDDFSQAKKNIHNKYVHFLTHIHTDHLKGLNNSWQYGTIYCSKITKQLLLLKFPDLKCLKQLELYQQHVIALSPHLEVSVTFMNANHCAGAVLIMIQGYMGRILYTGDMRFDRQIFAEYNYLYPANKRNINMNNNSTLNMQNTETNKLRINNTNTNNTNNTNNKNNNYLSNSSKQIDVLYLDNTFLNKRYNFPSQKQAIEQLDKFMIDMKQKNEEKYIYIGMDNYGKQQVLIHLSQKYNTYIVVDQNRYQRLKYMDINIQYFTTNSQQGYINVVRKNQLNKIIKQNNIHNNNNCIGLILTGWVNKFHQRTNNIYCIPYSLHSNYYQLCQFVDSIRPSYIFPIVSGSGSRNSHANEIYQGIYGQINYQEALSMLRQKYTSKVRQQYWQLLSDEDLQKKINEKLLLNRSIEQINKTQYGLITIKNIHNQQCKGYKLNNERDEQQIQKLKKNLQKRKMMINNDKKPTIKINRNNEKQISQNIIRNEIEILEFQQNINNNNNNNNNIDNNNKINKKYIPIEQIQLNKLLKIQIITSNIEIQHFLLNNNIWEQNKKKTKIKKNHIIDIQ